MSHEIDQRLGLRAHLLQRLEVRVEDLLEHRPEQDVVQVEEACPSPLQSAVNDH